MRIKITAFSCKLDVFQQTSKILNILIQQTFFDFLCLTMGMEKLKRFLHTYRRILIMMLTPIIISPMLIVVDTPVSFLINS